MNGNNYSTMSLDDLRRHVLTCREDLDAFHAYIDRSKAAGRMISINLNDSRWEERLAKHLQQQSSDEG